MQLRTKAILIVQWVLIPLLISTGVHGDQATDQTARDALCREAKALKNMKIPYRFGRDIISGTKTDGLDCSSFIKEVFYRARRMHLPRASYEQARLGRPITCRNSRPGDLVFFVRGKHAKVYHVGMVIEGNQFIHTVPSRKGISIEPLRSKTPWGIPYCREILKNNQTDQTASVGNQGEDPSSFGY